LALVATGTGGRSSLWGVLSLSLLEEDQWHSSLWESDPTCEGERLWPKLWSGVLLRAPTEGEKRSEGEKTSVGQ
jgi:hypothetical protein